MIELINSVSWPAVILFVAWNVRPKRRRHVDEWERFIKVHSFEEWEVPR
jgi:hypothetical protein